MGSRHSSNGPLGVVLAAGWGRRMGGPKARARTPDGRTFLEAVTQVIEKAGVARIVVVVGPWWDETFEAMDLPRECKVVVNPDPDRGLISSLRLAISEGLSRASGVFMALVDHPMVSVETCRALLEAHRADHEKIVVPVIRQGGYVRRGHPVIFPAWSAPEFFGPEAEREGPRAVLRRYPDAVLEIEVQDRAVILDLDYRACYRKWLTKGLST